MLKNAATENKRPLRCLWSWTGGGVVRYLWVAAVAWLVTCDSTQAQMKKQILDDQAGVEVIERTGVDLPLDAGFTNDAGNRKQLFDYFDGTRPVLLSLN